MRPQKATKRAFTGNQYQTPYWKNSKDPLWEKAALQSYLKISGRFKKEKVNAR